MPRFHCPVTLQTGDELTLPAGAARHVQVLRMQPGGEITLFSGGKDAGEFVATITHMGRSDVGVLVGAHCAVEREPLNQIHLAISIPANDRMDWLVEKATELGVSSIQPLMSERSVLRLSGERADKKRTHWQAVAVAACEQCGRNRVPPVYPMLTLTAWLTALPKVEGLEAIAHSRLLLSLRPETQALTTLAASLRTDLRGVTFLSGPEGGLSMAEEDAALAQNFQPVSLGSRVLRAETAALAALTLLSLE